MTPKIERPNLMRLRGKRGAKAAFKMGHSRAFSLVEVTIATGVMAFAAITIMGLIPDGLSALMNSSQTTIATRLAAEVQSEIQQVGLESFPTQTTYFDVDGKPLTGSSGAVYEVHRVVQDCSLPGSGAVSTGLRRVIVQVVKNPGRENFSQDASGLMVIPAGFEERTFRFHVFQ